MELTDHLKAIRRNWWIVLLVTAVVVAVTVLLTERATPTYRSSLTFYVATSSSNGNALQADEFAQRRVNSYAGVATSERLAEHVVDEHPEIGLTPGEVARRVTAIAHEDTVLLTVEVDDTSAERAHAVASAIAEELGPYVQRLERTGSATIAAVSLTVVDGPSMPTEPVAPDRTLNLAVALLAGLALGVALAIARQLADRSVRSTDALAQAAEAPTLAEVPAHKGHDAVLVGEARGTPLAESYRRLRGALRLPASPEVVLVTSPGAREGRTTTAVNLAVALAETGRRVLLVDADLRRPKVAGLLGLDEPTGLAGVLAGEAELADAVQAWGTDGLHVLPAGPTPANPAELLAGEALGALVDHARAEYDVVVLDSPAVLPVADAAAVAPHAGRVVLVARRGRTTGAQVREAALALGAVGARVAGTVLVGGPAKPGAYPATGGSGRTRRAVEADATRQASRSQVGAGRGHDSSDG